MTTEPPLKKFDGMLDGSKALTEKLWTFVQWIAELVAQRQWSKLLLLADVVLLFGFNPPGGIFQGGLLVGLLPWPTEPGSAYGSWFWAVFGLLFCGAIAIAVMGRPKSAAIALGEMAERKAIKGLRSFEMADAEIFAQLERQDFVQECLLAIARKEFRLGVVAGESGSGKTSVLQAGLMPILTMDELPGNLGKRFGVYVKFTEREPLETIRRALVNGIEALELEDVAGKNLRGMFEAAAIAADRPVVLILDQFEQFFVHFSRREAREPFIQEVAAWYRDPNPAAVGMLIGIRGEWFDRLFEFQKALGCSWGPQDIFSLRKFEPVEAARVLETIAETEGLRCDRRFLVELTEDELARREDGLISPADVQVLASMVARGKSREMRAFDRDAFQKLGGIEGLMERFLQDTLAARMTTAQRESALEVLLALTDLERGTRAGTRLLGEIGEKCMLSPEAIREAADWLARGDVRLVTVTDREGQRGYELAHERLIPALRRVADKELSEASKANQLLDRRTNEWLGNDRERRYLLGWKELREIRTQQPYLVWGSNERHKRRLIQLSQRRLNVWKGVAGFVAVAIGGGVGWYISPYGQIQQTRWDLMRASVSASDDNAARAVETLAEGHLFDLAWAIVEEEMNDDSSKARALSAIASAYTKLGDPERAAERLNSAQTAAEKIDDDFSKSQALSAIASVYGKLGDSERAVELLNNTQTAAEKIDDAHLKSQALSAIASAHGELGDLERAVDGLNILQTAAEKIDNDYLRSLALSAIASPYGGLGDSERAVDGLNMLQTAAEKIDDDDWKSRALSAIASAHRELGNSEHATALLNNAQTAAEKIDDDSLKSQALSAIASVYGKLGDPERAAEGLKMLHTAAEKIDDDSSKSDALRTIASAYEELLGRVGDQRQRFKQRERQLLDEVSVIANKVKNFEVLTLLAMRYAELGEWSTARRLLKDCPPDEKIEALATILVEWEKQHQWVVRFSQDELMGQPFTKHLKRIKEVRFK